MKKAQTPNNGTARVDKFMAHLEHPLKDEVQAVRASIIETNKTISDEVKWKAPSFSCEGASLMTISLWTRDIVHLAFHNPAIQQCPMDIVVRPPNVMETVVLRRKGRRSQFDGETNLFQAGILKGANSNEHLPSWETCSYRLLRVEKKKPA